MSGYDRGMPQAAPGYGGYPQGEYANGDQQQWQHQQQQRHPEQMHNQQGHHPGDQHQQQYPQHQSMENIPNDAPAQGAKPEPRKLPSLWLEAWQVRRPRPPRVV